MSRVFVPDVGELEFLRSWDTETKEGPMEHDWRRNGNEVAFLWG